MVITRTSFYPYAQNSPLRSGEQSDVAESEGQPGSSGCELASTVSDVGDGEPPAIDLTFTMRAAARIVGLGIPVGKPACSKGWGMSCCNEGGII